jgi:uncharacterized protein (DUF433 family)
MNITEILAIFAKVDSEIQQAKSERIVSDPKLLGGSLVFRGTRISVFLVGSRMSRFESLRNLFEDYPSLSMNDLTAAYQIFNDRKSGKLNEILNYYEKAI